MAGLVVPRKNYSAQGWDCKTQRSCFGITVLPPPPVWYTPQRTNFLCNEYDLLSLGSDWKVKLVWQKLLICWLYIIRGSQTCIQPSWLPSRTIFRNTVTLNTPIEVVRSAYRWQDEQITLTTLDKLMMFPIDMLTTVLILVIKTAPSTIGWLPHAVIQA